MCMFFMVAQNHWGEHIYEKSQLFNYSHESELDIVSTDEKAWQIQRKPLVHMKIQTRQLVVGMSS